MGRGLGNPDLRFPGNIVQIFNTNAMIRGYSDETGKIKIGILKD